MLILVYGKFRNLHGGHIRFLRGAKSLGGSLKVGIQGSSNDEDVDSRIKSVSDLGIADAVVQFQDLEQLIRTSKPDIVVKGLEFRDLQNNEEKLIQSLGGTLLFNSGKAYEEVLPNQSRSLSRETKFAIRSNLEKYGYHSKDLLPHLKLLEAAPKVVIVGDLILDRYHDLRRIGQSSEEGLPVFEKVQTSEFAGGAGVVASHFKGMKVPTRLISIVGRDINSRIYEDLMKSREIPFRFLKDPIRTVTLKERYREGGRGVFRVNHLNSHHLTSTLESIYRDTIFDELTEAEVIVFSDFALGATPYELVEEIIEFARKRGIFVASDSQTSSQVGNLGRFVRSNLLMPTERELRTELKDEHSGIVKLSEDLLLKMQSDFMVLKLGPSGMLLHTRIDERFLPTESVPALNPNPLDVTGAGDAALAYITLFLALGISLKEASVFGALASAIHISRVGNEMITKEDITSVLSEPSED